MGDPPGLFLVWGETTRAVSRRFDVPERSKDRDILSSLGRWRRRPFRCRSRPELTKLTARFAMLLAAAGILPLLAYGAVSIFSLRTGTRQSVVTGNLNVARRAAEQIELYVDTNVKILQTLAADLEDTSLEPWQQDRILKNYVLDFPEFREITLFDATGRPSRRAASADRSSRPDASGTP